MNSIWSVSEAEKNGEAKFKKPSTVSQQIEFAHMMMSMDAGNVVDTFKSMGNGSLLSADPLILPTRDNVEQISAYMEERLSEAFKRAGIASEPAVTFSVGSDGSLNVRGDRDDIGEIQDLFDNNPELSQEMSNFMALASQMPHFERALEFQIKYENADSKREIDALLKEYADLFDGEEHYSTEFSYDSGQMDIDTKFTA